MLANSLRARRGRRYHGHQAARSILETILLSWTRFVKVVVSTPDGFLIDPQGYRGREGGTSPAPQPYSACATLLMAAAVSRMSLSV